MIPEPRADLPLLGRVAWGKLYAAAVLAGIWEPQYIVGLEMVARFCAQYVGMVRALAASGEPVPRRIARDVAAIRTMIREQLFQWHYIGDGPVPPLRPDGLDPDIARLCEIPLGNG